MKLVDTIGQPLEAKSFSFSTGLQSTQSKSGEFNTSSDSFTSDPNGKATGEVESGYAVTQINPQKKTEVAGNYTGATVFFNISATLDLSDNPVTHYQATSDHYGHGNLGVSSDTTYPESTAEGWLRVYKGAKSTILFTESDTLKVIAVNNGAADVAAGADLVISTTAGKPYLDIYYAVSSTDALGHANQSIRGTSSGQPSHYDVMVNETTYRAQLESCGRGRYTVVYFDGPA
jgi:hypothetical protein